ncbi:MAG: hypothetical protein U0Q18_10915 [Bryobacteraceae bacterium]
MPFRRFAINCLATILLAGGATPATDLDKLVPIRWQGGPLEVARRSASKPLPIELAETLRAWYGTGSLDLLRDTPVNCLLVTWTGADPEAEREQHRVLKDYTAEAHRRGISVMALIPSMGSVAQSAAAAVDAGLDGLVLDGEYKDAAQVGAATRRLTANRGRELPVLMLPSGAAATAPGVRVFSEGGAVQATPTSEPWIDSNFWLVRLIRARGAETAWLGHTLEKPTSRDYVRAIADAAAAGGHWIVAPDDALITGLAAHSFEAGKTWREIAAALRFFEDQAAWRNFLPTGPLGIVQEETSTAAENLNLIARRRIPYRILRREALSGDGLADLRAVLVTGCNLSPAETGTLRKFAESGGLVIAGPGWGGVVPKTGDFDERPTGKGRVAVYREEEPESEALSKDVLHLIGKDNLGIRLFHAITVIPSVSTNRDGSQLLIAMVNYAGEPADAVMIRLTGNYRSARLYTLDNAPTALELEKSPRGVEAKIPVIPVFAAVVLEK